MGPEQPEPSNGDEPSRATGPWWMPVPGPDGGVQPAVLGWRAVREVLRDRRLSPRSFTDDMVRAGLSEETARQFTPLFRRHGDEHRRHRALLAAAFTPRRVERLRPVAARLAERLADALPLDEPVDFVSTFARPLPPEVFAVLFGLPPEHSPRLAEWAEVVAGAFALSPSPDELTRIESTAAELRGYCEGLIDARRHRPTDDLVSHLLEVEVDGERLDDREVVATISGFIFAGAETTRRQLTALILDFGDHPEAWSAVADDETAVVGAVEEVLRHRPIVPGLSRVAVERFEYQDLSVEEDGRLLVSFDAANRDPDRFAAPDEFEIARPNADEHVTFGWGPHYCLGAGLARVELQESLRCLSRRFGPPVVRPEQPAVSSGLAAPDELWVTFPPTGRG